ncbi:pilus assembly protein TadG-related protein [Vibrio sp. FJH11]
MRCRKPTAMKRSQQGITLVLISLIMLILIGMGAFAMDLNHQVLNKARLQNAVDSAALASAVVADETNDLKLSEEAAIDALNSFASSSGNQELVYTSENISITFSTDNQNFAAAGSISPLSSDDIYVRVAVSNVNLTQYLSYIFGVGKDVSASAVAGPSAAITHSCNLTPMAVCSHPNSTAEQVWGYNPSGYDPTESTLASTIHALKVSDQQNTAMGAGNFQLIDFSQSTVEEVEEDDSPSNGNNGNNGNGNEDGAGASLIRRAMAGGYNGCATIGNEVVTKTGNNIGPVAQGLNTRLNDFTGPIKEDGEVKPDIYVKEATLATEELEGGGIKVTSSDFFYKNYLDCTVRDIGCVESENNKQIHIDEPKAQPERRILRIPIIDCSQSEPGKTNYPVKGFGCFFLLQKVDGNASTGGNVFGQFLYDCPINNGSTGVEASDAGFYRIQLYKDPLSGAS